MDNVEHKAIGLLTNFKCDSDRMTFPNFEVCKFSLGELEDFFKGYDDIDLPDSLIEELKSISDFHFISYRYPEGAIYLPYFLANKGRHFFETPIIILNFFKGASSPVQLAWTYTRSEHPIPTHHEVKKKKHQGVLEDYGFVPSTNEVVPIPATAYSLTDQEAQQVVHFYQNFLELVDKHTNKQSEITNEILRSIVTAVYFHSKGDTFYFEYPEIERLINYVVALEALLSDGSGEITHKISMRCSVLLETPELPGDRIFKFVKKIYDFRSKIIHGRFKFSRIGYINAKGVPVLGLIKRSHDFEPCEYEIDLRECVRRCIISVLGLYLSGCRKRDDLTSYLDICCVNPAERSQLHNKRNAWKELLET